MILGFATLAAAACVPPAETVDTAADVAAIEAVRGQEVAALMAGDTVLNYMADDIVVMPPGQPQVVGKAAARAWTQEFMAAMTVSALSYTDAVITVSGDWASERYTGSLTMMPAGGGDAMTETLKGIHIYRKSADGMWKMVADIWNSDAAPPMM